MPLGLLVELGGFEPIIMLFISILCNFDVHLLASNISIKASTLKLNKK
jgi:hypothetical protein